MTATVAALAGYLAIGALIAAVVRVCCGPLTWPDLAWIVAAWPCLLLYLLHRP
jgi:hypothetical protein